MVTTMKRVSIGNLSFAITATPLLLYATQVGGAPGSGIAMSAVLLAFGGGTTAGLTYITKVRVDTPRHMRSAHSACCWPHAHCSLCMLLAQTYIKRIMSIPDQDAMNVVTPTFFGGDRSTEVKWSDVQVADSMHPFATFVADGRIYYLDELGTTHGDFAEKIETACDWKKVDQQEANGGTGSDGG